MQGALGNCAGLAPIKSPWVRQFPVRIVAGRVRTWFQLAFRLSKAAPARRLVEETSAVLDREPLGNARANMRCSSVTSHGGTFAHGCAQARTADWAMLAVDPRGVTHMAAMDSIFY